MALKKSEGWLHGISREVRCLCVISFISAVGFGIQSPAIPLFGQSLGVGSAMVGMIIAAFPMARLIAAWPAGRLVDFLGEYRLLCSGLALPTMARAAAEISPTLKKMLGGLPMAGVKDQLQGMVAALELRNAGYRVQVLEFNNRPGGRVWTLRGGDRYTELGGDTQDCGFAPGQYINPGPWRLPHHHHGILAYCRRLGVALENFVQVNYNALLHDPVAFGGKPQRLRAIKADYQGQVAELLAKASRGGALDAPVSAEDKARMVQAEDCGELMLFLARMPAHVCLNEVTISPTHNRMFVAQAANIP